MSLDDCVMPYQPELFKQYYHVSEYREAPFSYSKTWESFKHPINYYQLGSLPIVMNEFMYPYYLTQSHLDDILKAKVNDECLE